MDQQLNKVTLETLADGGATERFNYQLEQVLENIADLNTKATVKRSITLVVTFQPNEDRNRAEVSIVAKSTLAPMKPESTSIYISGTRATEYNPKQPVFEFEKQEVS